LIRIKCNEIHLWYAKVPALSKSEVEACTKLLSEAEQERCEKLLFEHHRHEYLMTRALVRTTLSQYLSVEPEEWQFTQGLCGKPKVEPSCGLQFNLSNTPSLTACLVSSCCEVKIPDTVTGEIRCLTPLVHKRFSLASERSEIPSFTYWTFGSELFPMLLLPISLWSKSSVRGKRNSSIL
jgi:4'-phosphopantetheinyl transferase